jgi:hypothetical protein
VARSRTKSGRSSATSYPVAPAQKAATRRGSAQSKVTLNTNDVMTVMMGAF